MLTPEEERLLQQTLDAEQPNDAIPENSPTILISDTTSRFSGADWYDEVKGAVVSVLGVGGIGSNCCYLLSRLNIGRLVIYDPDTVEESNIAGQFFKVYDIGKMKVAAIYDTLRQFSNFYNCYTFSTEYTRDSSATGIMMCGFDNMAARKTAFESWHHYMQCISEAMRKKSLFIDGRLNMEEYQVFAIQGTDEKAMKEYMDKWLFDDEDAEETICSRKQTTFMATMIASTMVNIFINFMANLVYKAEVRCVPFFTYYDAASMYNKIIV